MDVAEMRESAENPYPEETSLVRVVGPIQIKITNLLTTLLGFAITMILAMFAFGKIYMDMFERVIIADLKSHVTGEIAGVEKLIGSVEKLISQRQEADSMFRRALDFVGEKLTEKGVLTANDKSYLDGLMATVSPASIKVFGDTLPPGKRVDLAELRKSEKIVSVSTSQLLDWHNGGYIAFMRATDPEFDTAAVDFYSEQNECATRTYAFSDSLNFKFCCIHATEEHGARLEIIAVSDAPT